MSKYEALLRQVNIVDVVARDFDLVATGKRYYKGDLHDSLVVDSEKQIFYWNSIEVSGNALDWLTQIKGMPLEEAVIYLKKVTNFRDRPDPNTCELDIVPNIYQKLSSVFYEYGKTHREYWYNRGYTDETIHRFQLGFTGRCYVIPIFLNGTLLNFQCRTPDKQIWAWVKGLGTLPYNFDALNESTKSVIITEAPVNAIALGQLGYIAVSQTTGAGAWMSMFNRYLVHAQEIIFAYDNDMAGFLGARRVAKHFKDRARILVWPNGTPEKFDPNDYLRLENASTNGFLRILLDNTYSYEVTQTPKFLEWMKNTYDTNR